MRAFFRRLRQLWCSHEVRYSDIVVVNGGYYDRYTTARCRKCGKKLAAEFGLALPARLVSR